MRATPSNFLLVTRSGAWESFPELSCMKVQEILFSVNTQEIQQHSMEGAHYPYSHGQPVNAHRMGEVLVFF